MITTCNQCGKKYDIDDSCIGQSVKCLCGNQWTIEEEPIKLSNSLVLGKMREVKCPKCKRKFEESAKESKYVCPYCHHTFNYSSPKPTGCGCLLIIIIGFVLISWMRSCHSPESNSVTETARSPIHEKPVEMPLIIVKTKAEPVKAEPVKVEPVKVEPVKTELTAKQGYQDSEKVLSKLSEKGKTPKLTTRDGRIYEDYKVTLVEVDGLTITHLGGVKKLPIESLPQDIQKQYGYASAKFVERIVTQSGSNIKYRIVKSKYYNIKALDKPLSSYSLSEVKSMPINIRKEFVIIVPYDISVEGLKSTLKHVIQEERTKNPDTDEIIVFAHGREEDVAEGFFTFGKVEWCPNGDWAGVTPYIASSNDRSSYQYVFNIKKKVGNLIASGMPTKEEFAIYDVLSKELRDKPNLDEKIIAKRVSKMFSVSEKELNDTWIKVLSYQIR